MSNRVRPLLALFLAVCLLAACSGETEGESNGDATADVTDEDTTGTTDSVDSTDDTDTRPDPQPGSWRLPDGYYTPAKMEMHVVHPRNDEAADWAFCKNAHPGVRWEIPIVVQGGAWPFKYEIIDNDGASGLDIGGELERSTEGGFVVHRVTPEYGVLSWDDPVEGQYEVTVRVTDQDDDSVEVPISLTVGTDGWVFVDAQDGSDDNEGTVDAPFETIQRIHDGGSEFANHRVYLSGTVPMDGNRPNGNFRIAGDTDAPAVWVGQPGGNAVLEAYEGKFVLDAPDFYLANLEHRHAEDFFQDEDTFLHMITVWSDTDRYTVHDVHFSRFHGEGTNVGLGNSSIMMLTKNSGGRQNVAVVNNLLSGDNGILTSSYQLRHAVFEKNRAVGADFQVADGSVWSQIYIKSGNNEWVTLRANEFWDQNVWSHGHSALGVLQARNIELAYNTIRTPYDSGRHGALKLWTNSPQSGYEWSEDTPVWIYRNSLRRRVSYEGDALANMPDGTVVTENNVLHGGQWPQSSRIVDSDNLDGETYFDDQMKLTGEARDDYLGQYGAEIAVPAE